MDLNNLKEKIKIEIKYYVKKIEKLKNRHDREEKIRLEQIKKKKKKKKKEEKKTK